MIYNVSNNELSGVLPSWKNAVLSYMKKAMQGLGEKEYINDRNISNIDREYNSLLYSGYKVPEILGRPGQYAVKWNTNTYDLAKQIRDRLNIPLIVVLNYFLAVYDLSKSGKIDYSHFNPVLVKQSEKQKKKLVGKTVVEKAFSPIVASYKMLPLFLVGGGVLAFMYLTKEKKDN